MRWILWTHFFDIPKTPDRSVPPRRTWVRERVLLVHYPPNAGCNSEKSPKSTSSSSLKSKQAHSGETGPPLGPVTQERIEDRRRFAVGR
jgi:hypothetical protein